MQMARLYAKSEIDADMFVIAEAIIERRSGAFEPAGPSTALAFYKHASVVMPLLESPVTLTEAFDDDRWDSPQKLGSHRTCMGLFLSSGCYLGFAHSSLFGAG